MARITVAEANAWSEPSKLTIAQFDDALLAQIEAQVLSALANSGYNTSTWTSVANTPQLVRAVIAMLYVAWNYDKHYSEDVDEGNAYAALLRMTASANIEGIADGTFVLADATLTGTAADSPSFYPNDNSSLLDPTVDDRSLGDASFSMGRSF